LNNRKENLESKLSNQNFVTKAPQAVVVSAKKELERIQNGILEIRKSLDSL
jgi:valyl-tRNA synthetase